MRSAARFSISSSGIPLLRSLRHFLNPIGCIYTTQPFSMCSGVLGFASQHPDPAVDFPADQDGRPPAQRRRLLRHLRHCRARMEMPGCSLCIGNQARVADNATVVSTSTRNFPILNGGACRAPGQVAVSGEAAGSASRLQVPCSYLFIPGRWRNGLRGAQKISGPAARMAMRRPAAKTVTGGKQSRLVITLYVMVKPARAGFSPVSIPARTVVKHPVWWSSNPSVS